MSFEETEKLSEGEATGVAELVSLRDGVASRFSVCVMLSEIEIVTRSDFDSDKSAVKEVGGILVRVSGPTIDSVEFNDSESVPVGARVAVGGDVLEDVIGRLAEVDEVIESVFDCVGGCVNVRAGLTVSVTISDNVLESVLVS